MELILVCFGVLPFLAGRTVFASAVTFACYFVYAAQQEHELTPKTVLLAIAVGVLGAVMQATAITVTVSYAKEEFARLFVGLKLLVVPLIAMVFASLLLGTASSVATEVTLAGFDRRAPIILAVGVTAFAFTRLREWFAATAEAIPFIGESKVQRTLLLAEMIATVVGLVVAITFPRVGFFIMAALLLTMIAVGLAFRGIARLARAPCAACSKSLHRGASLCPHCRQPRVPSRIGVLGRVVDGAPAANHRLVLLTSRRCPSCAEGIRNNQGDISCPGCGIDPLGDPAEVRAFVAHVDTRAMALAPVFAAMGFVPVLGPASRSSSTDSHPRARWAHTWAGESDSVRACFGGWCCSR